MPEHQWQRAEQRRHRRHHDRTEAQQAGLIDRFFGRLALDGERRRNLPPERAIREACLERFRPILMTTMAAMLGALPLALGTGTGSEMRRPLGIAIIGGLMVSQVLTVYTTPVVYLYFDRLQHWRERARLNGAQPAPRRGEA